MIDETIPETTSQTDSLETVRYRTDRTTAIAPTIPDRTTGLAGIRLSGYPVRHPDKP